MAHLLSPDPPFHPSCLRVPSPSPTPPPVSAPCHPDALGKPAGLPARKGDCHLFPAHSLPPQLGSGPPRAPPDCCRLPLACGLLLGPESQGPGHRGGGVGGQGGCSRHHEAEEVADNSRELEGEGGREGCRQRWGGPQSCVRGAWGRERASCAVPGARVQVLVGSQGEACSRQQPAGRLVRRDTLSHPEKLAP